MGKVGVMLGNQGEFVLFDLAADGIEEKIRWVAAGSDEEFLALDRDDNGAVDHRGERFGKATRLPGSGESAQD